MTVTVPSFYPVSIPVFESIVADPVFPTTFQITVVGTGFVYLSVPEAENVIVFPLVID